MIDVVSAKVPDAADAYFLHERYRSSSAPRGRARAYYVLKPLLPRGVQLAIRRSAAQRQRRTQFPRWPVEDAYLRHRAQAVARRLAELGRDRAPMVGLWPDGHRFAVVLTHDVESREGVERIPDLLAVERRHGFRSAWNFCADWYPLRDADLDLVRGAGGEIGLHGIRHDGRLFQDRPTFEGNLPAIRRQLHAWGAVGFRSPALRRRAEWMHELPCLYDSSFPHTDPFQADPGGCCSIHPYFYGDVVELPVTLDQDFTLFELLRERSIRLWTYKSQWIIHHRGLINVIVHPDYMNPTRLALYEEFLTFLAEQGGWVALPRDVAKWWSIRDRLVVDLHDDGSAAVRGPGADRAGVTWVAVEGQQIAYDA